MKAAIVGAGAAGLLHALCYRAHGVPVATVFDPDEGRARALAEMTGAGVSPTLEALAACDAACVSVCSPPRWHVAQAEQCARPGRTLLVEKPVAVTAEELGRLEHLPGAVPVLQWRAGRAIRAVRRAVIQGELGAAPTVCIDLAWHRDEAYFEAGRGSRATWGCGALLSVGIHATDAVCFALEQNVRSVVGTLGAKEGRDVETSASLAIAFAAGALATLRLTLDAGTDRTTLSFAGGGVTATIRGTEADPTASEVEWASDDAAKLERLTALERSCDGHTASPLLVPYLGAALKALRQGLAPGSCDALPAIRDAAPAHDALLRASACEYLLA